MALKLVKNSPKKEPEQTQQSKSREDYLITCLREEIYDPKFTDWERNFIASLSRLVRQGKKLTEKQIEVLERLWAK
jgi:hypothetical protein